MFQDGSNGSLSIHREEHRAPPDDDRNHKRSTHVSNANHYNRRLTARQARASTKSRSTNRPTHAKGSRPKTSPLNALRSTAPRDSAHSVRECTAEPTDNTEPTTLRNAKPSNRHARQLNTHQIRQLHMLPLHRFRVLLHSLFKVLFNFPSRYLYAIGLAVVFSLR